MFTGIIKEVGKIINISNYGKSKSLEISCKKILDDIKTGDSVSVNGCCLTVTGLKNNSFTADLSEITVKTTTFQNLKANDYVNLEDALKLSDKLGGHFVSGHIDGIAKIDNIKTTGNSYIFKIIPPGELFAFIATKGSVCLDGISLTVADVNKEVFSVSVIPHTFEWTTLKYKKTGSFLNIEVDLIARYIENILKRYNKTDFDEKKTISTLKDIRQKDNILKEKLIEYGFFK